MSTTPYTDGTFTTAKQLGVRKPSYPFGNASIPDTYPVVYDREMVVLPGSYSPGTSQRATPTNLLTYSEAIDNAAWTKENATISANVIANPNNGSVTGDIIFETAANGTHDILQSSTVTAVPHVFSCFVRTNGRNHVLLFFTVGGNNYSCFFNVSAVTVGTASGAVGSIYAVGNSWARCSIVFTPTAGAGTAYVFLSTDGASTSYAGDINLGISLYGAQLEVGSAAGAYIPTVSSARTGSAPNIEKNEALAGSDPFAYLVAESNPQLLGPGALSFSRTYARVPGDQVVPGSRYFNRPIMHGIKSGTAYAVSFDDLQQFSWVFTTARKAVTRVASTPSVSIPANMPSSNITFVEGGRTLNIAANSTAASFLSNFASTLTGLTNVACNVSTGFMSIVWSGPMTSVAVPSGVVIVQYNANWVLTIQSTGTQTTPATTTFDAASHGGVVGDKAALWAGDDLVGFAPVVMVPSTGTFTVMTNSLDAANTLITHCAFSSDADACYVNGPKQCTVKSTQKFYLPGVTSGITTYADIPDQTVYTDPVSWLGRILAVPTGYACIAVADLTQWMGPILMQEVTEIQMSDAIDTVTP